MKSLLKLEELAQFLGCLFALVANGVPWWAYLLLLIGPDIGMLGYLISPRAGAISYNLLHHKGVAVLIAFAGLAGEGLNMLMATPHTAQAFLLVSVIMFGHSCMDRLLGYGLKYNDAFKHTHLGWIGGKDPGQ